MNTETNTETNTSPAKTVDEMLAEIDAENATKERKEEGEKNGYTETTEEVATVLPATPTPTGPTVAALGSVSCGNCGKTIFNTTNRIELQGAVKRVVIERKDTKFQTLAAASAYCNTECFCAAVSRK